MPNRSRYSSSSSRSSSTTRSEELFPRSCSRRRSATVTRPSAVAREHTTLRGELRRGRRGVVTNPVDEVAEQPGRRGQDVADLTLGDQRDGAVRCTTEAEVTRRIALDLRGVEAQRSQERAPEAHVGQAWSVVGVHVQGEVAERDAVGPDLRREQLDLEAERSQQRGERAVELVAETATPSHRQLVDQRVLVQHDRLPEMDAEVLERHRCADVARGGCTMRRPISTDRDDISDTVAVTGLAADDTTGAHGSRADAREPPVSSEKPPVWGQQRQAPSTGRPERAFTRPVGRGRRPCTEPTSERDHD